MKSNLLSIEYERIKDLTAQLDKNPKNIFALKELADIYLLQEDYNKAVGLYEMLVASKPSVETEKLKNAYEYGILNYGVALAKLKRYDDALKVFKEKIGVGLFNEACLTHYLGMYYIAKSIYQRLKLFFAELKFKGIYNRDLSDFDEHIEKAYLQMQLDFPYLTVMISKDGKDKQSTVTVPLDTALQRAKQEGRQDLYTPLFMEAIDIVTDFSKDFSNYLPVDRTEIALIEVWARLTDDIIRHEVDRMIALKNRCLTVISDSKDVLNITTTNALQESYREKVSRQITLVKIIYDGISKYEDSDWTETKSSLLECLYSCNLALNNKIQEYESLGDRFVEEENKVADKWEVAINKEKAEWREKLRRNLYSNWTPIE